MLIFKKLFNLSHRLKITYHLMISSIFLENLRTTPAVTDVHVLVFRGNSNGLPIHLDPLSNLPADFFCLLFWWLVGWASISSSCCCCNIYTLHTTQVAWSHPLILSLFVLAPPLTCILRWQSGQTQEVSLLESLVNHLIEVTLASSKFPSCNFIA